MSGSVAKPTYSGLHPLTTADMAAVLGISVNAVGDQVKRGVLVRAERGLFDPGANIPTYLAMKIEAVKTQFATDGAGKTRIADAKASLAELELKRRRRELKTSTRDD